MHFPQVVFNTYFLSMCCESCRLRKMAADAAPQLFVHLAIEQKEKANALQYIYFVTISRVLTSSALLFLLVVAVLYDTPSPSSCPCPFF